MYRHLFSKQEGLKLMQRLSPSMDQYNLRVPLGVQTPTGAGQIL